MSERVYVLSTTEAQRWQEVLDHCDAYDIYHLPAYHKLAEGQDDVRARLFVFEDDSVLIAMPLLLRKLRGIAGIGSTNCCDVTSVYGYPGPVVSRERPSEEAQRRFGRSLQEYFVQEKVVTAFSRLNPLLDQSVRLRCLGGQVVEVGPTVAIDLRLPADAQRQKYRTNHKRDITRLQQEGVVCIHDEEWKYLDAFAAIYCDSMRRTGASGEYFYDREYFERLHTVLGDKLHLFVTLRQDQVLAGGLLTTCNAIIQYHLAGTDSRYFDIASSKLIIDTVRLWGNRIGARLFHLGGGVRAQEDSLFHFKAGFSDIRYQFKAWRAVVDPEVYEEMVRRKQAWNDSRGLQVMDEKYFPAYRSPTQPVTNRTLCGIR